MNRKNEIKQGCMTLEFNGYELSILRELVQREQEKDGAKKNKLKYTYLTRLFLKLMGNRQCKYCKSWIINNKEVCHEKKI